jgi:hypothetical protein
MSDVPTTKRVLPDLDLVPKLEPSGESVTVPKNDVISFPMKEWAKWRAHVKVGGTAHPIKMPEPLGGLAVSGEYISFHRESYLTWEAQPSMTGAPQGPDPVDVRVTIYKDPFTVEHDLLDTPAEPQEIKLRTGQLIRLLASVRDVIKDAAEEEGLSLNLWAERVLFEAGMNVLHKHLYSKPMTQVEREIFSPVMISSGTTWVTGGSGYPRQAIAGEGSSSFVPGPATIKFGDDEQMIGLVKSITLKEVKDFVLADEPEEEIPDHDEDNIIYVDGHPIDVTDPTHPVIAAERDRIEKADLGVDPSVAALMGDESFAEATPRREAYEESLVDWEVPDEDVFRFD